MVVQRDVRDAWIEVDLARIQTNIRSFQSHVGENVAIWAAVKANAYGHGLIEVAKTAMASGAAGLCVAILDEALYLRRAGMTSPILVLGRIQPDQAWVAAYHHIAVTVFQQSWLQQAADSYDGSDILDVHLKLDTGMSRIGTRDAADMKQMVAWLDDTSIMHLEGIFTHFATADYSDEAYFVRQYERFQKQLAAVYQQHDNPLIVHCANSATALNYPDKTFDAIRLGISMYGLTPSEEMTDKLPFSLESALSLHSCLIHVKQIEPGDGVSYGIAHVASEREWIGTVPVGYGDGWPRRLGDCGEVIIAGERMPIVGKICMDFFMVKLSRPFAVGEKVTLIGRQESVSITADEIARKLGTINYEVTCMLHERLPRRYV